MRRVIWEVRAIWIAMDGESDWDCESEFNGDNDLEIRCRL